MLQGGQHSRGCLYGRLGVGRSAWRRLYAPWRGSALEVVNGNVKTGSGLVKIEKLPASRTASLDAVSTFFFGVVAWMALAFGMNALPDGLLVPEFEHGASLLAGGGARPGKPGPALTYA